MYLPTFFQTAIVALCCVVVSVRAFVPLTNKDAGPSFIRPTSSSSSSQLFESGEQNKGFFQGLKDAFQEIDNFLDDASARRLGNGAAF